MKLVDRLQVNNHYVSFVDAPSLAFCSRPSPIKLYDGIIFSGVGVNGLQLLTIWDFVNLKLVAQVEVERSEVPHHGHEVLEKLEIWVRLCVVTG